MTDYLANLTRVKGLTLEGILPEHGIVKIRLSKKNGNKRLILNFQNILYLLNGFFNLVSLELLNNISIHYNNKNQTLYNKVF